jgi:hypothetical protein
MVNGLALLIQEGGIRGHPRLQITATNGLHAGCQVATRKANNAHSAATWGGGNRNNGISLSAQHVRFLKVVRALTPKEMARGEWSCC